MGLAEDLAYWTGRTVGPYIADPGEALHEDAQSTGRSALSGAKTLLGGLTRAKNAIREKSDQLASELYAGAAGTPRPDTSLQDVATDLPGGGFNVAEAERSKVIKDAFQRMSERQIRGLGADHSANLGNRMPIAPAAGLTREQEVGAGMFDSIQRATNAGKAETATPGSIKYQLPGGEWKEWTPHSEQTHGGFVTADINSLGPQQRIDYDRAAAESSLARALAQDPFAREHAVQNSELQRMLSIEAMRGEQQRRTEGSRRADYMREIQLNDAAHQKRIAQINADPRLTPEDRKVKLAEADSQHEELTKQINTGFGIGARMTSNELYK